MRSCIKIDRLVSISLVMVVIFGSLQVVPVTLAEDREIAIRDVSHFAGNTDVYVGKVGICVKIVLRETGASWPPGKTDSHGRIIIYTGTVVAQSELQAFEIDCPRGEELKSTHTSSLQGVVTVPMETKHGQVTLTLPADMRAGDTISGTVQAPEAPQNNELEGAVIEVFGKQHKLRDRVLTFVIPTTVGAIPVILRDNSGTDVARSQIPVNQNMAPNNLPPTPSSTPSSKPAPTFQPPRVGQIGRPLTIPGNFDGDLGTTRVGLGPRPVEMLAESPRQAFVRIPDGVPAESTNLTIEENVLRGTTTQTVKEQFKFNPIGVELSADKLHLRRGERTSLHVTIRGLELDDHEQLMMLELQNLSPQVVHFASSQSQSQIMRKSINPSKAKNGVIRFDQSLTGLQPGAFTITANLRTSAQELPGLRR